MTNFTIQYVLPSFLGFLAGIMAPIIVEKWKGSKEGLRKQIFMEAEISKLQETLSNFSVKTEEKITSLENQLKNTEISLSHYHGLLESHRLDTTPKNLLPQEENRTQ